MQESIQVSNHFQVGNIYNAAKRRKERWRGFVVLEKGQVIVQKIPADWFLLIHPSHRWKWTEATVSSLELDGINRLLGLTLGLTTQLNTHLIGWLNGKLVCRSGFILIRQL
jgi:hypothetical protein